MIQNDSLCHPIWRRYRRLSVDIGIDIDAQKFIYGHRCYFLQISTKMHRISNVLNSYTDIGYIYVLQTSGTMLPTSRTISCLPAGRAGQVPQSIIVLTTWLRVGSFKSSCSVSCMWTHMEVTIPMSLPDAQLVISSLLQWGPAGRSGPSQLPWRCGCLWWQACWLIVVW
jgi:hypothetical protein